MQKDTVDTGLLALFSLVTQSMPTEVAKERDGDRQTNKLCDKHRGNACTCATIVAGIPVPQFHQTTLLPVGLEEGVTGVLGTTGDWDVTLPICHTMNSTALKQVLDSIKVIFEGCVAFWTGLSVDLQASHHVVFKQCVNLSTVEQEHTGHGQLHQHQDEQQDEKTDEHAAVLLHASQHSQITHAGNDGTGDHQSVGGVDGPEGGHEGGKIGVNHLELPQPHDKCTAQPAQEVESYHHRFQAVDTGAIHPS